MVVPNRHKTTTTTRQQIIYAPPPATPRTRITQTVPAEYVHAPTSATPIIRPVTPPRVIRTSASLSDARVEFVDLHKARTSPRASGVSVNGSRRRSRSSRIGDDVYIEQEKRIVLAPNSSDLRRTRSTGSRSLERPRSSEYRYLESSSSPRASRYLEEGPSARRSAVVITETNPKTSGRLVERVVVEDGGRRREYYRRN